MGKQVVRGGRYGGGKSGDRTWKPLEPVKKGRPVGAISLSIDGVEHSVVKDPVYSRDFTHLVKVGTKFDKAFSTEKDFYVGVNGTGSSIKDRYQRFEEFLKTKKPVQASAVSVSADGRISFSNGRHRYAVMRDKTGSAIVSMDKESVRNARKFGFISD